MAIKRKSGSLEKKMLRLRDEYMATHPEADCFDPEKAGEWAISSRRYRREPPTLLRMFKRDMARALRNEYYEDPQGREVRKNHPVRGEQGVLWVDHQTARPEQIRVSLQTRRRGILADCVQCSIDFDSYNDNNLYGVKLPPMDFNFNTDLDELKKPTDYPEEKPPE